MRSGHPGGESRGWRRWRRAVVKHRRLKSDFNEHYNDLTCACHTDAKVQAFFADTPCRCSAMCCGNQRRYYGPTRQELRHALAFELRADEGY